jgi:hypothetical protein
MIEDYFAPAACVKVQSDNLQLSGGAQLQVPNSFVFTKRHKNITRNENFTEIKLTQSRRAEAINTLGVCDNSVRGRKGTAHAARQFWPFVKMDGWLAARN